MEERKEPAGMGQPQHDLEPYDNYAVYGGPHQQYQWLGFRQIGRQENKIWMKPSERSSKSNKTQAQFKKKQEIIKTHLSAGGNLEGCLRGAVVEYLKSKR